MPRSKLGFFIEPVLIRLIVSWVVDVPIFESSSTIWGWLNPMLFSSKSACFGVTTAFLFKMVGSR